MKMMLTYFEGRQGPQRWFFFFVFCFFITPRRESNNTIWHPRPWFENFLHTLNNLMQRKNISIYVWMQEDLTKNESIHDALLQIYCVSVYWVCDHLQEERMPATERLKILNIELHSNGLSGLWYAEMWLRGILLWQKCWSFTYFQDNT